MPHPILLSRLATSVLIAAFLLCGCDPKQPAEPRGVILISIDTLRADHLGAYGYERNTSPQFDALAEEGILFEEMLAHAPNTPPSHMSMLTGLLPPEHGFRGFAGKGEVDVLDDRILPLAAILKKGAFATAAFTGGGWMSALTSFTTGFDAYTGWKANTLKESGSLALEWLRDHPEERFFLFLHTFQVHAPYARKIPQETRDLFRDPAYKGRFRPTPGALTAVREGRRKMSAADLRHTIDLYDAGIRNADFELSQFVGSLRETGVLDEVVLIVTADHGEEFMEHGSTGHWRLYMRPNLHVPFLVRLPGAAHGGTRITERGELVDVMPTVLELLGMPPRQGIAGRSWVDAMRGGAAPEERAALAWPPQFLEPGVRSVIADGHQLLLDTRDDSVQLFDVETDPMCLNDIAGDQPKMVEHLRAVWEAEKPTPLAPASNARSATKPLRPDMKKSLEALGYIEPD